MRPSTSPDAAHEAVGGRARDQLLAGAPLLLGGEQQWPVLDERPRVEQLGEVLAGGAPPVIVAAGHGLLARRRRGRSRGARAPHAGPRARPRARAPPPPLPPAATGRPRLQRSQQLALARRRRPPPPQARPRPRRLRPAPRAPSSSPPAPPPAPRPGPARRAPAAAPPRPRRTAPAPGGSGGRCSPAQIIRRRRADARPARTGTSIRGDGSPAATRGRQRREALKELLDAGTRLRALPGARRHPQDGGVRRRQRRRRADVRGRGAGGQRGRAGPARSWVARESCWTSCWRRSALERAEVLIANVLKCRPPGNRDPQPVEIENCQEYLLRQVELIQPTVICTLGNFSTKLLRGDPTGITRLHGQPEVIVLGARAVRLYPIYHPAAALYTPRMLRDAARRLRRASPSCWPWAPPSSRAAERSRAPEEPGRREPAERAAPRRRRGAADGAAGSRGPRGRSAGPVLDARSRRTSRAVSRPFWTQFRPCKSRESVICRNFRVAANSVSSSP